MFFNTDIFSIPGAIEKIRKISNWIVLKYIFPFIIKAKVSNRNKEYIY